ncbi:MAG: DUF1178 family protein [Pseudomonadota bacterium]
MIRYALICSEQHTFESWFSNSAAFDAQAARGLVSCPVCGTTDVRKSLMAPNVSPRTRHRGDRPTPSSPSSETGAGSDSHDSTPASPAPVPAPVPQPQFANAQAAEAAAKVVAFMRAVKQAVTSNAEDVGPKFADEARKIHYGEADERPIYGEATLEEAQELAEEEIPFAPLPVLPEDRN